MKYRYSDTLDFRKDFIGVVTSFVSEVIDYKSTMLLHLYFTYFIMRMYKVY